MRKQRRKKKAEKVEFLSRWKIARISLKDRPGYVNITEVLWRFIEYSSRTCYLQAFDESGTLLFKRLCAVEIHVYCLENQHKTKPVGLSPTCFCGYSLFIHSSSKV